MLARKCFERPRTLTDPVRLPSVISQHYSHDELRFHRVCSVITVNVIGSISFREYGCALLDIIPADHVDKLIIFGTSSPSCESMFGGAPR